MKSQITDIFGSRDTANDVNLNNGYDVMNFLRPIIIPSLYLSKSKNQS